MATPAFAHAFSGASLAVRRVPAALWVALRTTHRDIATTVGISAFVHALLLLGIGAAMYKSGEDTENIAELSVQIETQPGPNSEEYTEAALPKPAPEPVKEVVDDPGTGQPTTDAAALPDAAPPSEAIPEVVSVSSDAADALTEPAPAAIGNVLTTSSPSADQVPVVEPAEAPTAPMPEPEQRMLEKNVQKVAQKLLDSNLTTTEITWQQDGQEYSARVIRQPAPDSTGLEQVIAEVMTDKNGKRMKTHLSLKRLAFSHFTQLLNHWDQNVSLHDDVIDGRFHSNSEIMVTSHGSVIPKFFGKVTTAVATMTYDAADLGATRNRDIFRGGFETHTDRVSLPRDMPDVVNGGDPADRRMFERDTRIIFNADGSFVWRDANGNGALVREEPSNKPRYLIAAPGAKLYVKGTVSGIFTVYSPGDIEIEDDLVYSKDPRQVVISGDFLALIAGHDVMVAPPSVTGEGDLHIDAAVFARRTFGVEEYDRSKPSTLFVFGSVTAGTLTATEPRYATKIDYDKRFEYLRPANFPMTRRYEVQAWDQDWEEVQKDEGAPSNTSVAQSQ